MKAKIYLSVLMLCLFSMAISMAQNTKSFDNLSNAAQDSSPTIIELLQNGEIFSIEITSMGCFHGTTQTLVINKEADVFTAYFKDKSRVLTEKEINAIINFELKLRHLSYGACTTIDTYVLRYGEEIFTTSDGTCTWNGGKKLLQQLGYVEV